MKPQEEIYQSENITMDKKGNYTWKYEMNMYKNYTLLFTVYKVLAVTYLIVVIMMGTLISCNERDITEYWHILKSSSVLILIFGVLGFFSYLILAVMYGGKYEVEFEMNEKQVVHRQVGKQFKKAEKLGCLLAIIGLMSKNPRPLGQGLLISSKNQSTSLFKNVESVKGRRSRNVIYVTQLLNHNHVYVADEDYDFVYNFIIKHCVNAKIKK